MRPWQNIKQFLRLPRIIIGEIAAIAIVGAVGASLPEANVFKSVWFAALAALGAASLSIVVVEQFRRVGLQWQQQLAPAHFQSAPFKAEFERPATTTEPSVKIWSERRPGFAGSLVFHLGLLMLMAAGALRALFATDATVDLVEGETLAPIAAAWSAQRPGLFAKPFHLDQAITLESVSGSRHRSGDLRELKVKLSAGEIAVNHQLYVNGGKVYLSQEFGPTALVEWNSARREAALLATSGSGSYEGNSSGPEGLIAHLRSRSERPAAVEVRVMRGGALLANARLGVGEMIQLPGGATLTLHGTPMWARLQGSRDSALWLAYTGMALVMLGATLIFMLIKRDFCIVITPLGERERVFVALKPQRFAPLFQERFEEFVRELGGDDGTAVSSYPCSAGWQPAVSPTGSRQDAACGNGADCQSAIQPTTSRRYDVDDATVRVATVLLLAGLLAFTSGCGRVSLADARQLVERYNQVVSEAYRRGDVQLIDPVVGPNESKKLTGLIGVRLDMGITLDSKLLTLEVQSVEQAKDGLRVSTKERWSYRDLKIGTGEQVGEASVDSYEMLYHFKKMQKQWVMNEIQFTSAPQVGRKTTTWAADTLTLHGIGAPTPDNHPTNQP